MLNNIDIVAKSSSFLRVLETARRVADSCANILITGESGTGKEIIAQLIHESSSRRSKPFVALNCAAIPNTLLESELFGYSKGAYTGAHVGRKGLFEEVEGGTLFLDEIADLEMGLQAKILRVIQERKIKRVGENIYRPVDIRLVAATHENLMKAVQEKKFREDLFFRLKVITIDIPPLRERREDIIPLADFFLKKYSRANGKSGASFSAEAKNFMLRQQWPGNVRELENRIERAVVLSSTGLIDAPDLEMSNGEESLFETGEDQIYERFFEHLREKFHRTLSLEEISQLYIQHILRVNQGAKDKTARDLGIDRKTLYRKLSSHRPSEH
ncbi:Transcriptional regulatory protein ZraR [compost metagenome]